MAAIEKYKAALPYYENAQDWFGAARAVETIGEALYKLTSYQDALSAFERAFQLVQKADQTTKGLSLKAKIANNIGAVASTQYGNQKALLYYLQAIKAYRLLGNRRAEAVCLMNIGNIYTSTGQPEEALQWYERALSVHIELDNKQQQAS